MREINFFLPMKPPTKTHQMKKVRIVKGKPVFYEPAEVKAVRQKFLAMLANHIPDCPFKGPLSLSTFWLFPSTKKHPPGSLKMTKPDTDNMIKLLKDCMTNLHYWHDDAQVAEEHTMKRYHDTPGIYISVAEIGGNTDDHQPTDDRNLRDQ